MSFYAQVQCIKKYRNNEKPENNKTHDLPCRGSNHDNRPARNRTAAHHDRRPGQFHRRCTLMTTHLFSPPRLYLLGSTHQEAGSNNVGVPALRLERRRQSGETGRHPWPQAHPDPRIYDRLPRISGPLPRLRPPPVKRGISRP
ncbi:unnamed protein product [Ectocarpus sp. 13 AM-2016]